MWRFRYPLKSIYNSAETVMVKSMTGTQKYHILFLKHWYSSILMLICSIEKQFIRCEVTDRLDLSSKVASLESTSIQVSGINMNSKELC